MPGRQQIPSFQLPSGTTTERDYSYNLNTVGNIFYNTDTSNVEIRHEDPSNNAAWRDLVVNNREIVDISGNLKYSNVRFFAWDNSPDVDWTNANTNPIKFDYTTLNDNNCYDTGNGSFTAPIHGIYRFSAAFFINSTNANQVIFDKSTDGGNNWYSIRTNNQASGSAEILCSGGTGRAASLTFMLELNSDDRIRPRNRNSTSIKIYMAHSFFCGELISAL